MIVALVVAIVAQCAPPVPLVRPRAIVAADRSGHQLDRPYPSAELRSPLGGVALAGFPRVGPAIGQLFIEGWLGQAARVARGFSATTPIYFRFESQPEVGPRNEGGLFDPVLLLSLERHETVPVNVRWIADSNGDPYLPAGTLVVTADETRPLRSGARYIALVS